MRRKLYGLICCTVMLGSACAISACGYSSEDFANIIDDAGRSAETTEQTETAEQVESSEQTGTVSEAESEAEDTSTAENTTEETAIDDDAVWDAFLSEEKYLDYLNSDYDGDAAYKNSDKEDRDVSSFAGGFSYARCDINSDGIDELIVDGRDDKEDNYISFGEEWIFVIDTDSSVKEAYHIYGYDKLSYSSRYEALVGMPIFRPFQGTDSIPFYRLNGMELEWYFALSLDGGQWMYDDSDTSKNITEEEKDEYISDSVSLDWTALNTTEEAATENTTETESGGSDTGSGYSGTNHADMDISEFDIEALCEAYWIDFGQVGHIYKFEPDGKVYVYDELGVVELANGSDYLTVSDVTEEFTYTLDGNSLSIDMDGGAVDFSMHAVTDIQEGVQDGEPGTGNVYFYEDGWDREDIYEGQPRVLGEVDMSDEIVSKAVNWIENQ